MFNRESVLFAHSTYGVESVSKDSTLIVYYSLGGQGVNADLAGGVDDSVVAQVHSHMDYSTFVVGEETEVVFVC